MIREWKCEWELIFKNFTPEWELRIAILFKFRCEWEWEWELPRFLDQLLISESKGGLNKGGPLFRRVHQVRVNQKRVDDRPPFRRGDDRQIINNIFKYCMDINKKRPSA